LHYFEFAQKDATLYEGTVTQSQNTGLDEIIEVSKHMNDTATVVNVSRILIKFNLTTISESIQNSIIPANNTGVNKTKYYLNLYDANPSELTTDDLLYAYPVSQSWTMGEGKFYDSPKSTEGVSWRYRTGETEGDQWLSGSNNTGGTWFSGSGFEASQSFDHETIDMRMEVTDIVNHWIKSSSAYPNEGFIVKRSGSIGNLNASASEGNSTRLGHFKFFSRDTHTIYPPKLEVMWDDSKWVTGSLTASLSTTNLEDMVLYMKGLRPEYKENSKVRFRLVGRERYPEKTFSTTSDNLVVKALPSASSFYSVRDALTEDKIVPFGSGSRLSCDSSGNYFNFWMNGLQPERYYKITYRVQSGSGTADETDQYFDEDFEFKVVR
jgi:hypothetical protein